LVEFLLQKERKFSKNNAKKSSEKIPFHYREIEKNENISLSYDVNDHVYSQVKIHLTS